MPHLKGEKDESTSEKQDSHDNSIEHGETATISSKCNEGPEMLLSFATTITKHAPVARSQLPQAECKDQSYVTPFSCDQRPSKTYERSTNDDSSPEPEGAKAISVFGTGARQLFPSPIRCTKAQNSDDDVDESDEGKPWQNRQSPTTSGGHHSDSRAGGYMYPNFGVHSYHGYPPPPPPPYMYHDAYSRNRQVYHTPYSPLPKPPPPLADPSSPFRKRLKRSNEENREDDDEDSDSEKEQNGLHSPASSSMGEAASKQRVISPSSSIEGGPSRNLKSQDDESTTEVNGKTSKSKSKTQSQSSQQSSLGYAQYPPPDASYSKTHSSYQQYYAPRTANYGYSYPHPFNKSHTPNGDWRMPPHASFPPPHVHAPYFPHPAHFPYGQTAPYHQYHYPPPQPSPPIPPTPPNVQSQNEAVQSSEKSDNTTKSPPSTTEIKSVAEWQRAALTTGKAPSTNRCLPLKGPIPSKFWGEADKARESLIPEFHQLVNYPDYLTKVRLNGTEVPNPTFSETGRRPCVMCGKLRICSASCAQGIVSAPRRTKVQAEEGDDEEEQDSTHIIPRQNKGLCTVCDVTVWVIAESNLEIKWCKGCKNFRPWAAFGDKGLATKCVRCRERQREKYANQKDELRRRRLQQNQHVDFDGGSMDALSQQQEIDAAKGLRDLLSASATI